jgi:hypothetical protein
VTTILQGDVQVPGLGKAKKIWIFGGLGVAGAFVGWRWYQASRSGVSYTDGMYTTPDQSEMGQSTGGGTYNPGGNTGSTETDGTTPGAINSNADWTNRAVELLTNAGYDPATVYAALGEFLAHRALDKTEATIARAAIAAAGEPPVGRPWSVLEESGTGTGTLPAPGGVKATAPQWDTVTVTWSGVTGASSYQVYRSGTLVGTVTGTTYKLTGLKEKSSYRFAVAAVSSTGKAGTRSAEVGVTTPAAPVMNRPPNPTLPKPGAKPVVKPKVPPYTEVIARRGDTVSKIASRYGKSWQVVWDFNLKYRSAATRAVLRSRGPNKIFAGTRIWVPR